jgi:serine phosphatase RsbU (regulator of sigma subunit)/anti-anti-sigma regulatory factor/anti-sigma regulatory factor (Ser/Thr protein kinase)
MMRMDDENASLDDVVMAIDQSPTILCVFEGPDMHVLMMNAAAHAVVPGRDVDGRPFGEAFPDLTEQGWLDMYQGVYHTGELHRGDRWRTQFEMSDGSVTEHYFDFLVVPWRGRDGEVRGVVVSASDVTEFVHARQAAEAENARLQQRVEETRELVNTLQRELLPCGLPVLPGASLAATYLVADDGLTAGGDWFDAVVRPDGSVALVVGDVVGHGVTASGIMGQLRAVLIDRLGSGDGIAPTMAAVDRFARLAPAAHAATLCLAVLDPDEGGLTYCTAGHPPPLVVAADGSTRYLSPSGGGPLATGASFPERTDRLDLGDLILLYSDGILERPGRDVTVSTVELARVASSTATGKAMRSDASPAERVCQQTLEILVRNAGHDDDITLLAAQRVEPPADLLLELEARPASAAATREGLGAWLDRLGIGEHDAMLLQHAVGELVANAVEHGGAPFRVHGTLTADGHLELTVADRGGWIEPVRQSKRGRGLAIVTQLVDELRLTPIGAGTTAFVRHRPTRPPSLPSGDAAEAGSRAPRPRDPQLLLVFEQTDGELSGVIRVDGPVDAATAGQLQRDLLRRSRGGTVPLTVDLTGVTHLASAGVAALHQTAERHRRQDTKLNVYAAPGSVAQHILALVDLTTN